MCIVLNAHTPLHIVDTIHCIETILEQLAILYLLLNFRLAAKKKKEPKKAKYRSYTEARKDREKFRKRLVEASFSERCIH